MPLLCIGIPTGVRKTMFGARSRALGLEFLKALVTPTAGPRSLNRPAGIGGAIVVSACLSTHMHGSIACGSAHIRQHRCERTRSRSFRLASDREVTGRSALGAVAARAVIEVSETSKVAVDGRAPPPTKEHHSQPRPRPQRQAD